MKRSWILLPVLSVLTLACGDDAEPSNRADTLAEVVDVAPPDSADPAETVAETSPETVADTADATPDSAAEIADADTRDTAEADTPANTCAPGSLAACEYPGRGLTVVVRDGLNTIEPVTGRALPLVARIPATAGPLPVVLWSHGGGFYPDGELLSETWGTLMAEHGYVVIHVGHSAQTAETIARYCDLAAVPEDECVPSEDEEATGLLAIGRSYDLAAVLQDLPRLSGISVANGGPALDLGRVALAGWSGGTRGPMMLMGAKVRPTPSAPIFTNRHPLPRAAILMSPAGPGFGGWYGDPSTPDDSSWSEMRGPIFGCTGDNDQKPDKPELTGPIRRAWFPFQPADGKRVLLYSNLAVGVGGHGTYNLGDITSDDARLRRLSGAIASVARAFLDASMNDDAAARAWLLTDNAATLAGDVDWVRR